MSEISSAGVIGLGNAGMKHRDAYLAAGLEVRTYDPDDEKMAGSTLDEALDCDVVSICSPDDTHWFYASRAVERKKHVLVEKPLTHFREELAAFGEIAQLAARNGTVLECHLPLRYHPPFVQLWGLAKSGALGRITNIDMAYHYGRPEKMKGWRGNIPGYSLITGGGIHLVDQAMQLVDYQHTSQWAAFQSAPQDTRSTFVLGETLCTLTTTCHPKESHRRWMRVTGSLDVAFVSDDEEIDYGIGISMFLDKVYSGGPRSNMKAAILANELCLDLVGAL